MVCWAAGWLVWIGAGKRLLSFRPAVGEAHKTQSLHSTPALVATRDVRAGTTSTIANNISQIQAQACICIIRGSWCLACTHVAGCDERGRTVQWLCRCVRPQHGRTPRPHHCLCLGHSRCSGCWLLGVGERAAQSSFCWSSRKSKCALVRWCVYGRMLLSRPRHWHAF